MYLPVEPGRLIGGRKIEDALYLISQGCVSIVQQVEQIREIDIRH